MLQKQYVLKRKEVTDYQDRPLHLAVLLSTVRGYIYYIPDIGILCVFCMGAAGYQLQPQISDIPPSSGIRIQFLLAAFTGVSIQNIPDRLINLIDDIRI